MTRDEYIATLQRRSALALADANRYGDGAFVDAAFRDGRAAAFNEAITLAGSVTEWRDVTESEPAERVGVLCLVKHNNPRVLYRLRGNWVDDELRPYLGPAPTRFMYVPADEAR